MTAEGSKLQYIEIVDAKELKGGLDPTVAQMLGPQIGPLIQALAGSGSTARSASAAPPKPRGAIVIQGLDIK